MAEKRVSNEIHDYADGWIQERKHTDVPTFLKFAYIAIAGGVLAYFFLFMFGEVHDSTRGVLVRQLNAATQSSPALMYFIAGLIVIYAVVTVIFAFKKVDED